MRSHCLGCGIKLIMFHILIAQGTRDVGSFVSVRIAVIDRGELVNHLNIAEQGRIFNYAVLMAGIAIINHEKAGKTIFTDRLYWL